MSSKDESSIMYITLSSYLQELRAKESSKPEEERLDVPMMKTLAEVAGVTPSTLSFIAKGRTKSFNLSTFASIIGEMRRRGFNTQITDILKFEMPGESKPIPPPLTRRQRREYPGEEFVNAYAEASDNGASKASVQPKQSEMLPEVAEVMRILSKFPDPIQKDAAEALKGQLELVEKTLSFQGQSSQK